MMNNTTGSSRWLSLLLLPLVILLVRFALLRHYAIDEFTYAHASWLIAHGHEPFRDFFLHHFPLSMQLGATVFLLFGDSTDSILGLRCLMLPFIAITCISVAWLNRSKGWTAAILTPIFLLAIPHYVQYGIQFRPDVVAVSFFVGSLAVMRLRGPRSRLHSFIAGMMLVVAVWASEKVLIYGAAYAIALWIESLWRRRNKGQLLPSPLWFLAGAVVALVPIGLHLAITGGWSAWYAYGIKWPLLHEREYPGFSCFVHLKPAVAFAPWIFALGFMGWVRCTGRMLRQKLFDDPDLLLSASLVLSVTSFVVQAAPYGYSLIPAFVFLSVFAAREANDLWQKFGMLKRNSIGVAVMLSILAVHAAALENELSLPQGQNQNQIKTLKTLNQIVAQDKPAYDNSGAYVSRPHVHFMYFTDALVRTTMAEFLTREMPAAIRASGCTAFIRDSRFQYLPEPLKKFIRTNYQPYNPDIWLWGKKFSPGSNSDTFEAVLSDEYFIEPASEAPNFTIDGHRVGAFFWLGKGVHKVSYGGAQKAFHILWLPDHHETYTPLTGELPESIFPVQ